ncbi:hypothetical protein GCM10027162_15970 [Streptomyces incanus]
MSHEHVKKADGIHTRDAVRPLFGPALEQAVLSGRHPVLTSLSEGTLGSGFDHFEFGPQRILDGLEVLVGRPATG